jgi:membrane-bound ClpP family serine protease
MTSLRPVGKVDLDGDLAGTDYEARAESGLIEAGTAVEVVEVSAGRLLVRAVPAAGDPAETARS